MIKLFVYLFGPFSFDLNLRRRSISFSGKKMASFSMDDFVGDGVLKELIPKLLAEGWDDVPTLKMMSSEDMNSINMTQRQKDVLEIRSYLHDRALMQYGDRLEASGRSLTELLSLTTTVLSSQYSMRRGHVARFIDRAMACGISMAPSNVQPARRRTTSSISESIQGRDLMPVNSRKILSARSTLRGAANYEQSIEQSIADLKIKEGHVFKGIVASEPAESRLCGCVQPPPVVENVAPYSSIESISVQKLAPEYKVGMDSMLKLKTPPMKASELWLEKPVLLMCVRRPGCIMCRAEAHQLYLRKPIFDALGFQLIAVLHEQIDAEVKDFWPRYWGGIVILDRGLEFFKALGGGKLMKDKFISGFVFNPRAIANYKRAKSIGLDHNYKGEGEIKGGLFIVGSGKSGIAYQFIERNFGDWAPLAEVIEICTQMQKQQVEQEE
ncbi:uncharacterized protein LOC131255671 isoform X2 [Magnolia sinica]|uniref:uncharacterized protein LOC131255671 isoform X2 n=1 Tax=Magnolia sinica TaxID=86752 RepID=UPI00265B6007|nr:uncharacterized protein LOC131255671 isoform X2 [Magnolia sinica]